MLVTGCAAAALLTHGPVGADPGDGRGLVGLAPTPRTPGPMRGQATDVARPPGAALLQTASSRWPV
eukprot:scaffold603_cov404-Prasinococcus_capsulatus_cf.AAC.61